METKFKVAKYQNADGGFVKTGYDEYNVTFLKGLKTHQLRIVVNGYITKQAINIIAFQTGYRDKILSAVSEYVHKENINPESLVKKKMTLDYLRLFYSKKVIKNIENYLVNINKSDSRDELTKYQLIGDNK